MKMKNYQENARIPNNGILKVIYFSLFPFHFHPFPPFPFLKPSRGSIKRNQTVSFSNELFLTLNLLLKCKPFTQSGNRSELVSARAPGTCESSGRKKYFLSSSQNKEQIEGGYLAPGLVLTLTNFIQESNIISFIVESSIRNIK